MNTRKLISVICILLSFNLLLTGCPSLYHSNRSPIHQPNTLWKSEDGTMEFSISEEGDYAARGTMKTNDQILDVVYNIVPAEASVTVYLAEYWNRFSHEWLLDADDVLEALKDPMSRGENFMTEYPLEVWTSTSPSYDTFRIEVLDSTYFQEGDIITFHRVDS